MSENQRRGQEYCQLKVIRAKWEKRCDLKILLGSEETGKWQGTCILSRALTQVRERGRCSRVRAHDCCDFRRYSRQQLRRVSWMSK